MGKLTPKPVRVIHPPDLTEQQIQRRLDDWRDRLHEHDAGTTNCALTRADILRAIDGLLDELVVLEAVKAL